MRPAKVLLVLVIASAAAFAATSLSMGDAPEPRPGKKVTPPPQQGIDDALARYAAECATATRIAVPDFTCRNGKLVPGQKMDSQNRCQAPDVLNSECDPGSRFQVLEKNDEAAVVAHCRKKEAKGSEIYQDIAIIQYNKINGAVCFYQALGSKLPGTKIPSPSQGRVTWADGKSRWKTPKQTFDIGCTGCHDNGGFVRSPYIIQTEEPHKLPSTDEGYGNLTNPLKYVGAAFASAKSWSIEIATKPGDQGICTGCHRMAVSNHPEVVKTLNSSDPTEQLGSALAFGPISTAETQAAKTPHGQKSPDGPISPIWMRPPNVTHDPGAEAMALRFRDCAVQFAKNKFDVGIQVPDCTFAELGVPWTGE